jgi:DNA-binding transcriptional ArsR family regulator
MGKMTGRIAKEAEEIILQGIGHEERRNILKIIGSSSEGVTYSEILFDLKMNTGKLNYHLKLLEGLILRDDERRYRLTKLGMKSVLLLDGITADLDEEDIKLVSSAKTKKDDLVTRVVNMWANLVLFFSFTAILGLVAFLHFNIQAGYSETTAYLWLVIPCIVLVAEYFWLQKIKREAPEKFIEFLSRLGLVR